MIVVADISPLTNLASIGQFGLLEAIFGEIQLAEGVWDELGQGGRDWPGRREVARSQAFHRHIVQNVAFVKALCGDLDRGEAETIVLATELPADLVLLDEKAARRTAARLGLRVMGVLGVLLEAKTRKLVPEVRPLLDALRQQAGFYLGDDLFEAVLELAKETTLSR
jgi:hypothetical protein